jgi:predicted secreted protein
METLQLLVGDDFELRLPGRGTAGYGWVFQGSGVDGILSVTHSTVAPASTGVQQTGSADEVFTLRGLSPGHMQLQFELRRSWEKDTPAAQQRRFDVEVLPRVLSQ